MGVLGPTLTPEQACKALAPILERLHQKPDSNIPNGSLNPKQQRDITDQAVTRLKNGEVFNVLQVGPQDQSVTYNVDGESLKVRITRDGTKLSDDGINRESIGVMAEILERPNSSLGYTTAIDDRGVPVPHPRLEFLVSQVLSDLKNHTTLQTPQTETNAQVLVATISESYLPIGQPFSITIKLPKETALTADSKPQVMLVSPILGPLDVTKVGATVSLGPTLDTITVASNQPDIPHVNLKTH